MATKLEKTIDSWGRALLDLGRRNRMIHYRPSKRRALDITEPSCEVLFQKLVHDEKTLAFRRPIDKRSAPRTHAILSLFAMLQHPIKVTVGDLDYPGDYDSAQSALSFMRSQYRLAHEEQGCHILYLSFGFVEWRDGKGGAKGSPFVKSPLILVPVELHQQNPGAPYTIKMRDDDIVVNPSLSLVFERRGIMLPTFDENSDSLALFFEKIEAMADEHGWRVHREASLGLLSFQKISMYRDLEANRQKLLDNPFVRAMAGEDYVFPPIKATSPDSVSYSERHEVLPADSSQQEAILAAKRGESFVMEGPPGTGKSQTITNIIAELLADGKKILFVSGKNAALQVVYRRLQETGLAKFCLPLHSHRANKREILSDISASLSMKAPKLSENEERDLIALEEKRGELNAYRDALHTPIEGLGYTPYECVLSLIGRKTPILTLSTMPKDRSDFLKLLSLAQTYDNERAVYFAESDRLPSALFGILEDTVSKESLQEALVSLGNALVGVTREAKAVGISLDTLPLDAISALGYLAKELETLPEGVKKTMTPKVLKESLARLETIRAIHSAEDFTKNTLLPSFVGFDAALWYIEFETLLRAALRDEIISLFVKDKKAESLLSAKETLFSLVSELLLLNDSLDQSIGSLSRALGIPISYTYRELFGYLHYLPYLDSDSYVDPEWKEDHEIDQALLRSSRKNASAVLSLEEAIVKTWRADVFELDYKRLREKFTTSIHGIFGFVAANSRREVKRLLQSYTLDGEAPSDAAILALFDQLADRALALKRFLHREDAIKAMVGSAYRGVHTDFEKIERGRAFLLQLPASLRALPPAIKAYLALPKAQKEEALQIFTSLHKSLSKLKSLSDSVEGLLDRLEDCHNGEIHLSFAKNRLSTLIDKYQAFCRHTTRSLALSEIEALLDDLHFLEDVKAKKDAPSCQNERFLTALDALLALIDDQDALLDTVAKLAKGKNVAEFSNTLIREGKLAKASLSLVSSAFVDSRYESLTVKAAKGSVAALLEDLPLLSRFSPLAECYRALSEKGFGDAVKAYEALHSEASLEATLQNSVMSALLTLAKRSREALGRFSRVKESRAVASFASLDMRHITASRKKITATLAKAMPKGDREWRGEDELSVLEHENSKRRGFMPLRKLFAKIPNLLLTLKPCFMMSPLSVSYFLEKESYAFDLVIFDEASQLFPEDAIGAIMRGKQVIIVGDSKQLPPTNFFSTRGEDADEEDDDEEFDEMPQSILESANSVLPRHKLLWHYRSRYESLIAFSNHKIYQKELITFPSPLSDSLDSGIEYLYLPDGVYEPGKGQNRKEAEACVTMLHEHIIRHSDRSLGIIAFGKKQQRAIEEAITQFRLDNPQYEDFFSENRDEPFFIKNLENVQGDERDTIIFSIGYGKNPKGKFLMNFGPLTKLGGERRLNVAITRAKQNVKLIGSILPSDFSLAATESQGAHLLRAYIDYALNKEKVLFSEKEEILDRQDAFLDEVECFLTAEGYRVERQYGTSPCRVELAVFHPAHKSAIAALMTDGEGFKNAATARDREHLRYGILKRMGWRVYSLYALAWLNDREKEKGLLLDFLKNGVDEENEIESTVVISEVDEGLEDTNDAATPDAPYGFMRYVVADWARAPLQDSTNKDRVVIDRMRYLIAEEAPIHRELLFRRLASSFRSGKLTESVKKTLDAALTALLGEGITLDAAGFLRAKDMTTTPVRIPPEDGEARPFEYIAKEELAEAMLVILKNAYGALPDSLYHETARIFGYDRMTQKIRQKCEEALFSLLMTERVRLVEGKIRLLG